MDRSGSMDELRQSRKSMWRTRWLLVALSALLAVILLMSGAVIIGAIIGVMALVRTVMLVEWQRTGGTLGRQ